MPLPVLWHRLCLLIMLPRSPDLSIGNRWNAISISKNFCLSPRSLMPSWSPSLICCLPYAPSYKPEITISGFIGLPHFAWGLKSHNFLLVCILGATWSVWGSRGTSHLSFRSPNQKEQSGNHSQLCLNGKAPQDLAQQQNYQNLNQPCLWQKALKNPRASWKYKYLPCCSSLPTACPRVPGATGLRE